jgi:hypothetical protein
MSRNNLEIKFSNNNTYVEIYNFIIINKQSDNRK